MGYIEAEEVGFKEKETMRSRNGMHPGTAFQLPKEVIYMVTRRNGTNWCDKVDEGDPFSWTQFYTKSLFTATCSQKLIRKQPDIPEQVVTWEMELSKDRCFP